MALFSVGVEWLLAISFALCFLYYYLTRSFGYWKKRGVLYLKPIPIFGNSWNFVTGKKHRFLDLAEAYDQFSNERFFGRFVFTKPDLVVRDPDLAESVLIKNFSHFPNRGFRTGAKDDKLSQHLVNLRDQQWKNMRIKLSPVFTSGKLKTMHQTLITCCQSLIEVLDSYSASGNPFSVREVMGGFTTEVIGHCAFGISVNTLKNPDSEFRKMGRMVFNPSKKSVIRNIINLALPNLPAWLRMKSISLKMERFFVDVIKHTVAAREASNVEVPDFLQLLIHLRKADEKLLEQREKGITNEIDPNNLLMDDSVMASNSLVFFLAGFETTASTLSYCLFELAQNPHIQNKLREEVNTVMKEFGGLPTYDAVKKMHYLDQVISETLRKYPPAGIITRKCSKDWKLPDSDVTITKGTIVSVPCYSFHHDPQYFPEPDRFLPERFSEENKHNIRKGTYLPFGDGPRICIGKRFAEHEMKVALATMISKFRFTPNPKTRLPLVFHTSSIFLVPIGGLWINIHDN